MSAGSVKVGPVVSVAVITCTFWVVLLQSSVSVQVRVITCSPSQSPSVTTSAYVASSEVSQLSSSSVTSPVIAIEASYAQAASLYIVMSAGSVKVGRVVSVAVMI